MRLPRWLDTLILAFGVLLMASVAVVCTLPLWVVDALPRNRRRRAHELDHAHELPGGDRRPLWDGSKVWR